MSTYGNYQNAYKKASVNTLDQNKLIIMLYDGALKNATFAVDYMNAGDIENILGIYKNHGLFMGEQR